MDIRVGHGIDCHKFQYGKKLILGGVEFDSPFGLKGHSDADAVLHALTDAILGALGEKDIGHHFPDTDPAYKGADSELFLKKAVQLAAKKGFEISNIDITVLAEQPKINPLRGKIRQNIAKIAEIEQSRVNVKATTLEKMGFIGKKEGLCAFATVLIFKP